MQALNAVCGTQRVSLHLPPEQVKKFPSIAENLKAFQA